MVCGRRSSSALTVAITAIGSLRPLLPGLSLGPQLRSRQPLGKKARSRNRYRHASRLARGGLFSPRSLWPSGCVRTRPILKI